MILLIKLEAMEKVNFTKEKKVHYLEIYILSESAYYQLILSKAPLIMYYLYYQIFFVFKLHNTSFFLLEILHQLIIFISSIILIAYIDFLSK